MRDVLAAVAVVVYGYRLVGTCGTKTYLHPVENIARYRDAHFLVLYIRLRFGCRTEKPRCGGEAACGIGGISPGRRGRECR